MSNQPHSVQPKFFVALTTLATCDGVCSLIPAFIALRKHSPCAIRVNLLYCCRDTPPPPRGFSLFSH